MLNRFRNPLLKSFVICNKDSVQKQADIWQYYLPFIRPYYAVKSNNDARLLRWLTEVFDKPIGFDCASIAEMKSVRAVSGLAPILYAQPCKTHSDLDDSVKFNAQTTVVDSPEEMEKLHQVRWAGDTFIRLAVPDSNSKQPFSKKFGAPLQWVPSILELSKKYKLPITGVSFHVGSECENPAQFAKALQACKKAMDLCPTMDIIDIGGGFLPSETNLSEVAACIQTERAKLFPNNIAPNGKSITWIAEPGRFLSATSQTLYTPVIGKKLGMPSDTIDFRYTLHESVYGYFSNIPFDGQKPEFKVIYQKQPGNEGSEGNESKKHKSILFGRTCDGADIIHPNIELPELYTGDWLMIENMGSYTSVTASEFNGFPKPDIIYME
jgi:ornithine decarboxylase